MQLSSLLSKNKHSALGIDIGSSSVKLISIRSDGADHRVEHLAIQPLPAGAMDQSSIKQPASVSEAISRAWYQSAAKDKRCALAVPLTSTFSRMLYLPAGQSEAELESQVQIEAGQIVPFDVNEVSIDFQVIEAAETDSDQVAVLLVASRTENVNQLESLVDEAGLELAIVDIDKYALLNSYIGLLETPTLRSQTVALMHIGANSIIFMAVYEGKELYVKDINFGIAQLQQQLVESGELEDADLQIALSEPDERLETQYIQPFRQQLVLQINRAVQAYASSSRYRRIEHVFLTGGGSRLFKLDETLQEELDLPVEVADFSQRLAVGNQVSRRLLKTHGPSLAVAIGLALRGCE